MDCLEKETRMIFIIIIRDTVYKDSSDITESHDKPTFAPEGSSSKAIHAWNYAHISIMRIFQELQFCASILILIIITHHNAFIYLLNFDKIYLKSNSNENKRLELELD